MNKTYRLAVLQQLALLALLLTIGAYFLLGENGNHASRQTEETGNARCVEINGKVYSTTLPLDHKPTLEIVP